AAPPRQRPAIARRARGADRRGRCRVRGRRRPVLRRRAARLARGALGRRGSDRTLGSSAGRRGIRRPVRGHAGSEETEGVPSSGAQSGTVGQSDGLTVRRLSPTADSPTFRHYLVRMKLVLFDVDGTLLWTDGAGRRAIRRALLDEAGTAGPIDTYRFDGKTDPQIVRELLTLAQHPQATDDAMIQAVCRHYVDHLRAELDRPAQSTRILTGIEPLLAALEPHERADRALVGLLTGNVAPGAVLKLRSAGLDPGRFRVGAYGSDSAQRGDLPRVAAARASALTGCVFAGSDVVILGDTPDDVACGRSLGARSVAVATGFYDVSALRACGATYVFETLADSAAVLDAILA